MPLVDGVSGFGSSILDERVRSITAYKNDLGTRASGESSTIASSSLVAFKQCPGNRDLTALNIYRTPAVLCNVARPCWALL